MRDLVLFGAGLLIGAAAGFVAAKMHLQKEFEEKVNKEIDGLNKSYANFYEKKEEKEVEEEKEPEDKESKATETSDPELDKELYGSGINHKVNYRSFSEGGVSVPEDMLTKPKKTIKEEDEEEEAETYLKGLRDSDERDLTRCQRPKIIKYEMFGEDPRFEMMTLTYYQDNDVLVDESSDEEIMDIDRTVGDCLDKYNFRRNSEKCIYVRNFFSEIDYEIIKSFSAYEPLDIETG